MQRKLPGIDIPAATEANILHAAAFLEFKRHVERLAREGSNLAAYTCWMHGVEVCHSPYVMATVQTLTCSPRCPRCPVVLKTASAAQLTLAGSNSSGSDFGTAVESFCPRMWLPTKFGTISTGTRRQDGSFVGGGIHQGYGSTRLGAAAMACSSDAQQVSLGSWVGVNSSISGSAASAAKGSWRSLLSRASTRGLPGGDPGQPGDRQELEPIGHFVTGWKAKGLAHCNWARHASTAVTPPGASAGHAAWDYAVPASPGGSVVGTAGSVGRCFRRYEIMREEDPPRSPQHLFALRTLAILLGCSAMASGGKGYYAAQAAASSSSGGDPAPGWRAADSLKMIAAQRAHQWREPEAEGLLDDNDFAYAYTDYDQVVGMAGHHVADDCLQTRARVEEELLGWGQSCRGQPQELSGPAPCPQDHLQEETHQRGQEHQRDRAEEDQRPGVHVSGYGLLQAGILTDTLKAEWKQTCRRIAEKKVQDAEKATLTVY